MKKLFWLMFGGFFLSSAAAADSSALNRFLKNSASLQGTFSQQTFDKKGTQAEAPSNGHFIFLKPGMFKWVYSAPYEQEMVCDGKNLYVWDKDLDQVTVRNAKGAIPQSPASILFGQDSLEKDWRTKSASEKDGIAYYTIVPKKAEASVKSVTFGFKGDEPVSLDVEGNMGEKTRLKLTDLKVNEKISPSVFQFQIPKGADVVNIK